MSESEEKSQLKIRCPNCQRRLDVSLLEPFSEFSCPDCGFSVTVPKLWREYVFESRLSSHEGVEVYRALDTSLDREVIVELVTDSGGYGESGKEGYLSCIRRLSGVSDPSLSVVYACGRYESGVYSVVQYLPSALSSESRLSWAEIVPWLRPVLQGLEKASQAGICHGRLRLSCLRRTESGKVCVTGFGVGMALENRMSRDGYASPERLTGGEASLAGDMYSLGKILWHCLAGRLPEEGGVLGSEVPSHVVSLLRGMTSLSPFDRPQSYGEVLSRLAAASEDAPSGKRVLHTGGGGFHGKVRLPKGAVSSSGGCVSSSRSGGAWLKVFVVVLLVAVLVCLSVLLLGVGGGPSGVPSSGTVPSASGSVPPGVSGSGPSSSEGGAGAGVSVDDGGGRLRSRLSGDIRPLPAEWRRQRPKMRSPLLHESRRVSSFVERVPSAYREGVEAQVQIISHALGLLRQYTARVKYDRGDKTRLILYRDSQELHAKVRMSNGKGLWLERVGSSSEKIPERVRLEDLHWITFVEMLEYYGRFSYDRFQELPKGTADYLSARKALVHHYLVLTLLCDWYGEDKVAVKHARRCISLEPKAEKVLRKFGITVR